MNGPKLGRLELFADRVANLNNDCHRFVAMLCSSIGSASIVMAGVVRFGVEIECRKRAWKKLLAS